MVPGQSCKKKPNRAGRTKLKWVKKLGPSVPYLENLAVFILAICIQRLLDDSINLIDYRLFYIVAASFLFGRSQSILSIGLASFWYLLSNALAGQEIISQLIDHTTLVHIGLYIFFGLSLGYLMERKEKLIRSARKEVQTIQKQYQSLTGIYKDTLTVKNALQNQILYTNDSIGVVFNIMKELDSLHLSEIYPKAIKMTGEIMKTKETAFYILDESRETLRLEEKSPGLLIPESLLLSSHKTLMEVIKSNSVQINKELDESLPTMIAPVSIGGNVVGVIGIYQPEFEYLTLSYQNLFAVIASLISSALNRAYNLEQLLVSNNGNVNKTNKEEAYV